MKINSLIPAVVALAVTFTSLTCGTTSSASGVGTGKISHVLLLSIDGMHAVDLYNCSHGIAGVNNGRPYCPTLLALSHRAINYVAAVSSKPSDSFPGLAALITGGSPKSTGLYYDVAYDRSLDAPATTTGTGLAGGPCTAFATPTGTTTDFDQGIDRDDTKLNGGAPGAAATEGGVASIDPMKLVRDPQKGCAPVYPWDFIRTNTIFGVVHAAGGYTAWIDKHPSYSMAGGPGGKGLDDYYSPEVSSNVIALPGITTSLGVACDPVRDTTPGGSAWNSSFDNIQCYDALRVKALLRQISGKTHSGAPAVVPTVFGMNFQSVYIGQSVADAERGQGRLSKCRGAAQRAVAEGDRVRGRLDRRHRGCIAERTDLREHTADHHSETRGIADRSQFVRGGRQRHAGIGATEDDVSVLWPPDRIRARPTSSSRRMSV
jgi:hypothetical protein